MCQNGQTLSNSSSPKVLKHTETIHCQKLTNCLNVFDNFVEFALQGLRLASFEKIKMTRNTGRRWNRYEHWYEIVYDWVVNFLKVAKKYYVEMGVELIQKLRNAKLLNINILQSLIHTRTFLYQGVTVSRSSKVLYYLIFEWVLQQFFSLYYYCGIFVAFRNNEFGIKNLICNTQYAIFLILTNTFFHLTKTSTTDLSAKKIGHTNGNCFFYVIVFTRYWKYFHHVFYSCKEANFSDQKYLGNYRKSLTFYIGIQNS